MAFDDIFKYMGDFGGRYQKRIFILLFLPVFMVAYHNMAYVFLLAKPNFRCKLPHEESTVNYTLPDHVLNMSFPLDPITQTWSMCHHLNANFTDEYYIQKIPSQQTVSCTEYIYDYSVFKSSALIEWDIVCDKTWLRATSGSLYMVGVLLGSFLFGHYSDKYGRKPVLLIGYAIQVTSGVLAGVATNYIVHLISRIIVGGSSIGIFLVSYVMGLEMVASKCRIMAGVGAMLFVPTGYLITALCAYFISEWRWLQLALSIPTVLFLSYYWLIPESARWLLAEGRASEAIKVVQHAAKMNKVTIPQDVYNSFVASAKEKENTQQTSKPSILDLFRYPNLRKKTLFIFFDWFVVSGTYYGLSWNTNNLGGNYLLNFVISAAVEIPGYILLFFTLNRWGRRNTLCSCLMLSGTTLLTAIFIPQQYNWAIISLAMIGKMAITSSNGAVYVFSAEQFPTPVRNVGIGAGSVMARVGGICAPYINVLGETWKPIPFIVFGSLALMAGFMTLVLPETLNQKLPETIEDGERLGNRKCAVVDTVASVEEMKSLNGKV